MDEFLTVLPCGLLQPIKVIILLHILVNFLPAFHVHFYSPSKWIFYCESLHFLLAFHLCYYSPSRWKSICASGWISYCPSICAFTSHPGEYLTAHLVEFLTGLPCAVHPGESLTVHWRISHWPPICNFSAPPCESLSLHRCILTGLPYVHLKPIQVKI